MIPLVPYWKFVIYTSISQQEALARLGNAIAPMQYRLTNWWDTRPQPFTGTISNDTFSIMRIIHYRNSFLPFIYGRLLPTQSGLQIRIVMSLQPIVLLVAIGLSLCAFPFLVSLVYRFILTGHFEEVLTKPCLVLLFLYVLFTSGFAYEAVIARRLLSRIVAGNSQ